jgi:hypothetical protein
MTKTEFCWPRTKNQENTLHSECNSSEVHAIYSRRYCLHVVSSRYYFYLPKLQCITRKAFQEKAPIVAGTTIAYNIGGPYNTWIEIGFIATKIIQRSARFPYFYHFQKSGSLAATSCVGWFNVIATTRWLLFLILFIRTFPGTLAFLSSKRHLNFRIVTGYTSIS